MTMNQKPDIATTEAIGVVLAGGKSSRMGQDKADLQLAGESLLARARRTLLNAGCHRVVLSGQARTTWHDPVVTDRLPDTGPVGGIISTLQWLSEQHTSPVSALFIPVDTPLLSSALLRTLLNQGVHNDGCRISDSPLPLILNTTDAVLAQCTHMLPELTRGKSCSIRQFIQPLALSEIRLNESIKPLLVNVNTPTEWENLRREFENLP